VRLGGIADFYRPSEPDPLIGNAAKAHRKLNWHPKTDFEKLVILMAESDLQRARNGQVWY
jgi:GDPmannose 4,6-dehydratase